MKFTFAALALAAVARAQTRGDIPSCALDCLDEAIKSETSCSTTDYSCVCKDFNKIQGSATTCVIGACGADVAVNKVLPAVEALCAAVSSGAGSSTAAATSAAATSAAAATSSAAVETTAAVTTTAATTVETSAKSTKAAETTEAAATTPSSSANASTPSASEPSTSAVTTGGAATLSSIGGIAMLILAALAV